MVKKHLLIIVLFLSLSTLVFITFINAKVNDSYITTNVSNAILDSSLYTGVDDLSINPYKGEIKISDELITTSENGNLSLYFNSELCIFKIKNNITNMVYSSALDEINESTSTAYYSGFLSSSFSINYYQYIEKDSNYDINIRKAWLTRGLKHTSKEKEELSEEEKDLISLSIAPSTVYSYEKITNGIKVKLKFANATEMKTDKSYSLGIGFSSYVTLDNDGLHVDIPKEEIVEENSKYLLAGIMVMPLLGSTTTDVPGYMVIPDGSGALIRYGSIDESTATQYTFNYYSVDIGKTLLNSSNNNNFIDKRLTLPIFGFVNGIYQDALYGILESSSTDATLTVSPSGSFNIKQNFMYPTFTTRFTYFLYGVNNTMIDNLINSDIKVSYNFLSNEDASYVGIAKNYQDYLVKNGVLKKNTSNEYKTQIDFLLSEATSSLLGYKTKTLTSLSEATLILNELENSGINPTIVLKGWNKDGFTGCTPYSMKYNTNVGSKKAYKNFISEEEDKNNHVYLYNDYLISYSRGDLGGSTNTAKSLLKLRLQTTNSEAVLFKDYSYLSPTASLKLAKTNATKFNKKLGAKSIAIDGIGMSLFSYYDNNKNNTRLDCLNVYKSLLDSLSDYNIGLYEPNVYLYSYLDDYFNMSTYATPLRIYTDNVPFVSYVLKGYIDLYGNYLNFNSSGEIEYLRYLDYGCFGSFILTNEISHNLKYTNSFNLYTTCFTDWKDEIISYNNKYKKAYEAIINSVVEKRIIPEIGVSIVVYKNLDSNEYTSLIINYTNETKVYSGQNIDPLSYGILGGKYE